MTTPPLMLMRRSRRVRSPVAAPAANGDAHDHGDGDYRTSTHTASFENRPHRGSAKAPQPDNQQLG
jgi:hypothetical protein